MAPKELPASYDITVYRGDAYYAPIRIWYRDESGDAQLLDTDGWTGRMGVKSSKTAITHLLHSDAGQITVNTGIQGTGEDAYCVEIIISKTRTAALTSGLVGVYDLELTDTSGRPRTYLAGTFCVEGDVS